MSAHDRTKFSRQAIIKGELAYLSGVPISDCPYKDTKSAVMSYSLAPFWRLGWKNEKREEILNEHLTINHKESTS